FAEIGEGHADLDRARQPGIGIDVAGRLRRRLARWPGLAPCAVGAEIAQPPGLHLVDPCAFVWRAARRAVQHRPALALQDMVDQAIADALQVAARLGARGRDTV